MKRVFLIVLDSLGVGELPDADKFGDIGSNTLKSISKSEKFNIPTLLSMGLGDIDGIDFLKGAEHPTAAYGKCAEKSLGKDTTTGHWEIAGLISEKPFPTYKNGFPKEIIDEFSRLTGRGVLCNKPYSGTEVIKVYGDEHLKTGKLIVYTSADSVFQIAAHEDIVPPEELYNYCKIARKLLCGKNAVGRVIARPFTGSYPFRRTANRHDFSLVPPKDTLLDALSKNGFDVLSVGKIKDIFASKGITESVFTKSNKDGMEQTDRCFEKNFNGLCFVNLVEFDMLYGHRNDVDGYAAAVSEFDIWLKTFLPKLKNDDMLIITADHGCDPGDISTDHTREYIPLLIYGNGIKPVNLGVRATYADIGATVADIFNVQLDTKGISFKKEILK